MSDFRVHSRLVTTYRKGRAFLAGDAAHVHSPVGGQGMNVGMQDAINLGWKLAQVIRGGRDKLLDSYEIERRPVAELLVRTTERLSKIGIASSPAQRFLRDRLLPVIFSLPPVRRSMAQQASGIALSYAGSPLSAPGGGARAPFQRGFYERRWELFRTAKGGAVLVRPDSYIAARFPRADRQLVEDYFADRIGKAEVVDQGRALPAEEQELPRSKLTDRAVI
jgi:hypothetical protein